MLAFLIPSYLLFSASRFTSASKACFSLSPTSNLTTKPGVQAENNFQSAESWNWEDTLENKDKRKWGILCGYGPCFHVD